MLYHALHICLILSSFVIYIVFNRIHTGVGGGVGEAFDATQELNPYYSRSIASTVFLHCDFSSNLCGNNLVLSGFGS